MGPQSNSMVKKGSMDVGCGTYSFELVTTWAGSHDISL
jgi:hypothetical protein